MNAVALALTMIAAQHGGHAGHAMPAPSRPMAADPAPQVRQAPRPAKRTADPHAGHDMPDAAPDPHAGHTMPQTESDPHADHAIPDLAPDPHAGHQMAMEHGVSGTALPAGDTPAPAIPADHAADAVWGSGAMAPARRRMMVEEGGGQIFAQAIVNLAEAQFRSGRDGYRWDAEAWVGGDIHRFALKTEGEADFGRRVGDAEIQALYSRAVGPYFNLQAGVRQDVGTDGQRTHAVVGVEGLAPYWFDVEATAFLATNGDLSARVEGYYDQRLTQRLIAQPRVELNLAAQDTPGAGIGAGVTDAELGLRLRYEVRREFAPYLGVSWERKVGRTARFARRDGEDTGGWNAVAGIRFWF